MDVICVSSFHVFVDTTLCYRRKWIRGYDSLIALVRTHIEISLYEIYIFVSVNSMSKRGRKICIHHPYNLCDKMKKENFYVEPLTRDFICFKEGKRRNYKRSIKWYTYLVLIMIIFPMKLSKHNYKCCYTVAYWVIKYVLM